MSNGWSICPASVVAGDKGADRRAISAVVVNGSGEEEIAFGRAEILYRTGRRFDAHLAYRKLAQSKNARLALAARSTKQVTHLLQRA